MIYNNVELFNTIETEAIGEGVILRRFTSEATADMENRAVWMSYAAMGNEVRFVCKAQGFWITLGAVAQDVDVYVMRGDYFVDKYTIPATQKKTFQFENKELFTGYDEKFMEKFDERFDHNVWRFYFHSQGACVFYDCKALNGVIRPPMKNEIPQKTILAYGSSITHWCWALDSRNSYIQQAAKRLNMDVLNKGMAGACRLEDSTMEFLLSLKQWDTAFFELGANVVNAYSADEFRKRAEYLVSNICTNNPDKKIYLTGFYYGIADKLVNTDKVLEFEEVLGKIKDKYCLDNLTYIDGKRIMDSASYLSFDLVHPSDYGHIRMGENLAKILSSSAN